MGESYDQKDAAGFIRVLGLPSRSRALRDKKRLTANDAKDSQKAQTKINKEAEVAR
jgi:hypothetical protein